MDNPEILFYIVAAIIYFLTRKKKKRPAPPPRQRPSTPHEQEGPVMEDKELTFEDLLKEITGQKVEKPQPQGEVTPASTKPSPKPLVSEPVKTFDDAEITKTYEKATRKKSLKTISEIVAEEQSEGKRFEAFKIKEEPNRLAEELVAMLRDPEDVKKAVIASEIFNRRF